MSRPDRPTLLIFTLGESRETRRRRLLPPAYDHLERRLYRRCLEEALEAGRASSCRPVVAAPRGTWIPSGVLHQDQPCGRFSQRLQACLRQVSRTAKGPVVVVGTDTPGVQPDHVARALAALELDPRVVVVGPATDGGLYLLAASQPLPDLDSVAWCTRQARVSLVERLRREGRRVVLLDELADLDSPQDLERWVSHLQALPGRWLPLAIAVTRALSSARADPAPYSVAAPSAPRRSAAAPRAPPV